MQAHLHKALTFSWESRLSVPLKRRSQRQHVVPESPALDNPGYNHSILYPDPVCDYHHLDWDRYPSADSWLLQASLAGQFAYSMGYLPGGSLLETRKRRRASLI